VIARSVCANCATFECASNCFSGALTVSGRTVSVDRLMEILERDRNFWGPGGGVTFGGGEPLAQPRFMLAALAACGKRLIHTAIETCAHVPRSDLLAALDFVEWLFVDLKHMDPDRHREGTGADNRLVLTNIATVSESAWSGRLVIRVPVIPGFNDDTKNIGLTADFLADHNIGEVHLVPFHRLGASKYRQLGRVWPFEHTPSPTARDLGRHAAVFEKAGITCHLGSDTPF
jgi:pyruvate formate lyase activating enzyme